MGNQDYQKPNNKKQLNSFVRFTGLGLQMGLTIYLGSLLGAWLDGKYPNKEALYTKICTLVAVFGSMISVIIKVTRQSSKNND
ncbi:MAG: AtpZ/AtpI family protein [Flavobacteriaceae bacterium]|nr:AtpZ/AtpI family protein [Flavobacteriaceae bacterium]